MFDELLIQFCQMDAARLCMIREMPVSRGGSEELRVGGAVFHVACKVKNVDGGQRLSIRTRLKGGSFERGVLKLVVREARWNPDAYVMMPAAVYAGNRFRSIPEPYPPMLYHEDSESIGIGMPTTITDVPRLEPGMSNRKLQITAADMATPALCVHDEQSDEGFILLTRCSTELGVVGVSFEEMADMGVAELALSAPSMRWPNSYGMCTTGRSSPDLPHDFGVGEELTFAIEVRTFECQDIPALFERFFALRTALVPVGRLANAIPYSATFKLIERKYNRENWRERGGYYRVGTDESLYSDFQTGWVGGGIATWPLYIMGTDQTRVRSESTLEFILSTMQAPSGLFYGVYHDGKVLGDAFNHIKDKNWLLLRKNADMLLFLLKTYAAIREEGSPFAMRLSGAIRRCCDALVRIYDRYGQWGQFVDVECERIELGGTASSAHAVASMALAGAVFDNPEYLRVANQAGRDYFERFTRRGLSNGGPGEILQCPDSESSFALLEGYVTLYETTQDPFWLRCACMAAYQAASWCVSYDFVFPAGSEFARLGMHTTGAVWANVQNKHAAPGICTLSGDCLLRLYRYTSNAGFLRLLEQIAHTIPQYLSREDRPIRALDGHVLSDGYINERVNLSDWEGADMVGGVFHGSCWCECSAMLTALELPSVYYDTVNRELAVFDNLEVVALDEQLQITNPTAFDAEITIWIDDGEAKPVIDFGAVRRCLPRLYLSAGERITFSLTC